MKVDTKKCLLFLLPKPGNVKHLHHYSTFNIVTLISTEAERSLCNKSGKGRAAATIFAKQIFHIAAGKNNKGDGTIKGTVLFIDF